LLSLPASVRAENAKTTAKADDSAKIIKKL